MCGCASVFGIKGLCPFVMCIGNLWHTISFAVADTEADIDADHCRGTALFQTKRLSSAFNFESETDAAASDVALSEFDFGNSEDAFALAAPEASNNQSASQEVKSKEASKAADDELTEAIASSSNATVVSTSDAAERQTIPIPKSIAPSKASEKSVVPETVDNNEGETENAQIVSSSVPKALLNSSNAFPAGQQVAAATASNGGASQNTSKCTPTCRWSCSSPECEEVCTPVCDPPKCETRCSSLDTSGCSLDCEAPSCAVICPKKACPNRCPHCTTRCATPHCKLNCPNAQPCRNICEEPRCQFQCKAPEHCPKPQCQLWCEYPRGCAAGHRAPMPPPNQGEVTIRTFKGMDHKMAIATSSNSESVSAQVDGGQDRAENDKEGMRPVEPGEKIVAKSESV
eukprot:gnl/MRDRNA2_/MRDRNA2_96449_c0_seq1.p1 gnl/MRDRNA2_/MRDRNA2_96449_c0~~gnl/MRDRNA2_/MRDRNA2_96449_c0_seq1.p1  ORF type:complete len:401 (+),score=67.97 gnl/MRDRNA2_/MRDRNA2_96449_c0_seq1:85-1287(+)